MIYLSLSDTRLEVIQTGRGVTGEEKVISFATKKLSEGVVVDGLVKNQQKLADEIDELFASAEPKTIDSDRISLSIYDKQVFIRRLLLSSEVKEEDIEQAVIEEAKKVLGKDPSDLDSFYKEIKTSTTQKQIFYSAMKKSTIKHFAETFEDIGLKLDFLASNSLAVYELLKNSISKFDTILYCNIRSSEVDYYALDAYGLLVVEYGKLDLKSFAKDIKSIAEKVRKETDIAISTIILGGRESIRINASEVSDRIEMKVIKIGEIIDGILDERGLKFDTGGVPKLLFTNTLGLLFLAKSKSPPNFAMDLEEIEKEKIKSPPESKHENEEKVIEAKEDRQYTHRESRIMPDQITEHKKSWIKQILSSRIFIVAATAVIVFFVLTFSFTKLGIDKQLSLPLIGGPSETPIPTIEPTITPSPTIDPDLKRKDIKISVQNGTDITGLAGKTGDFLEKKGYKDVDRTNADRDDYSQTFIKIKESKKNYLPLLTDDLKDRFDISKVEDLEDDQDFDVVLILGSDANE